MEDCAGWDADMDGGGVRDCDARAGLTASRKGNGALMGDDFCTLPQIRENPVTRS